MAYDLEEMLKKFGVVDVMDLELYTAKKDTNGDWDNVTTLAPENLLVSLDTLTITNINEEGPTKEIKGGKNAQSLLKYGKTFTFESTDALGDYKLITKVFGGQISTNKGMLTITDRFAPEMTLVGKAQFVDAETGAKQPVNIIIPFLLPDSIFNLTQASDGDAATFDLNGTINAFATTAPGKQTDKGAYGPGGDGAYYIIATDEVLTDLLTETYEAEQTKAAAV